MDGGAQNIIENLYAGTLDKERWDWALRGIMDLVGASAAGLLVFNPSTGEVLRGESHKADPALLADYQRYWSFHDVRLQAFLDAPVGEPMTGEMMNIPDWDKTPILNEFLYPGDVPHFMPAWLKKSPDKAATLSLQATRRHGPFGAREIERYRSLLPHVTRALEIRDRLERAEVNATSISAGLDCAHFGLLVLDAAGAVLEANEIARNILASRDGAIHRNRDGSLAIREPAGAMFAAWIATGIPSRRADALLRVPRANRTALSLLLAPAPKSSACWMSADPSWLLFMFDPEFRLPVSVALVAKDLGITWHEAEVSVLLLAGESLASIAKRRAASVHTVRAQLKSVFKKTGIHSQAELVRRIALGPGSHIIDHR